MQPLVEPVFKNFSFTDVDPGYLFELGILFVHGIGRHKVRETLTKFGEPIVKFWENWFRQVTNRSAKLLAGYKGKRFVERVTIRTTKNRQDHEGITHWVEKIGSVSDPENGAYKVSDIVCGGVRVEDALFPDSRSDDAPASALVRLPVVGNDEKLREAHVLMSESWWTPQTVYPGAFELFNWIYTRTRTLVTSLEHSSFQPY